MDMQKIAFCEVFAYPHWRKLPINQMKKQPNFFIS